MAHPNQPQAPLPLPDRGRGIKELIDAMKANQQNGHDSPKEMNKELKEALVDSIDRLQMGDKKQKAESLSNLKLLRSEIAHLTSDLHGEREKLLEAIDASIEHGKKSTGVLVTLSKQAGEKADALRAEAKSTFKGMINGMIGEMSPFVKMTMKVGGGMIGYTRSLLKSSSASSDASQKALDGISKTLKEEREEGSSNATSTPEASVEASTEGKKQKSTGGKEKGKGPLVSAMEGVKVASDKQTAVLVELLRVWGGDTAVLEGMSATLERVEEATEAVGETLEKTQAQAQAGLDRAHDNDLDASREALSDDAKHQTKSPDVGAGLAKAVEDKQGGIISVLLSGIIGLLGTKITGEGIVGGILKVLKYVGKAVTGLLNPMNYVRAVEGVVADIPFLSKPLAILKSIIAPIGDVFKVIFRSVAEVGQFIGKFGSTFGEMLGPVARLGKGFLKLAKGIPLIGELIMVVTAIWDFFDGFINAGEVLGKKSGEVVTLWDRVSAGIGSLVGGLVGIVDSILGLFGIETDIGGFVKDKIAKGLAAIPDGISSLIDSFMETANGVVSAFCNSFLDGMKALGVMVLKGMLLTVPGGSIIADKLFGKDEPNKKSPDIQNAPKPTANFNKEAAQNAAKIEDAKANNKDKPAVNVDAKSNVNNISAPTYMSYPMTTRNTDDSHRYGYGG